MPRPSLFLLAFALLIPISPLLSQQAAEQFDVSGLPARPASFLEQQIAILISSHKAGDMASAAMIQRKLAQYYTQVGDTVRARAATERMRAAEEGHTRNAGNSPAPRTESKSMQEEARAPKTAAEQTGASSGAVEQKQTKQSPPPKGAFEGRYYYMDGVSTLHTWEFSPEGAYLYTRASRGAGTSVRTSERGTYTVSGGYLELHPSATTTGYATPSAGGRGSLVGGGTEAQAGMKRVKFQLLGTAGKDGIILDGIKMKPKTW